MLKCGYGVFKPDEGYVYIDDKCNFCFYQINSNNNLLIKRIEIWEKGAEIRQYCITSDSPYKPLFFRKGEWRLG